MYKLFLSLILVTCFACQNSNNYSEKIIAENKKVNFKYFKIKNECNNKHISFLKKWFNKDKLLLIKLNYCPTLPRNGSIQNKFESLKLSKQQDTLTIIYNILGLNNSQEKSWNFHGKDRYLIKNSSLIKI